MSDGRQDRPLPEGWRARAHEIIYEADTPAGKAFDVALIVCVRRFQVHVEPARQIAGRGVNLLGRPQEFRTLRSSAGRLSVTFHSQPLGSIRKLIALALGVHAGQRIELRCQGVIDLIEESEMTPSCARDRQELSLKISTAARDRA